MLDIRQKYFMAITQFGQTGVSKDNNPLPAKPLQVFTSADTVTAALLVKYLPASTDSAGI